eukprot:COSAG01_NODE_1075_length_11852_cov_4.249128_8_plen_76_part_00
MCINIRLIYMYRYYIYVQVKYHSILYTTCISVSRKDDDAFAQRDELFPCCQYFQKTRFQRSNNKIHGTHNTASMV